MTMPEIGKIDRARLGLPPIAGISLKPEFYSEALSYADDPIWYEVHPENYMVDGGPRLEWLAAFCDKVSVSFHGVGASLGGLDPFNTQHLKSLKKLIDDFDPAQVSEHATWSSHKGRYFADLLPLPRTKEVMDHMVSRIDQFQNAIGRRILIENPTNYMKTYCELDEPNFLSEIAKRAGCGLLLDVNNVFISAVNTGINAAQYIQNIPPDLVCEIHIAGFDEDPVLGAELLIDSHAAAVSEPVWGLLEKALSHLGEKPVLLERDGNIPTFNKLLAERERAKTMLSAAGDTRVSIPQRSKETV